MVDNAIATLNTTRVQHIQLQNAVSILGAVVNPPAKEERKAVEAPKEPVVDSKKK